MGEIFAALQGSDEIKQILRTADVGKEDLDNLLSGLEEESADGEISYERFCTLIYDIEAADLRKEAVLCHLYEKNRLVKHENLLLSHSQVLARLETKIDGLLTRLNCPMEPVGTQPHSPDGNGLLSSSTASPKTEMLDLLSPLSVSTPVRRRSPDGQKLDDVSLMRRSQLLTDLANITSQLCQLDSGPHRNSPPRRPRGRQSPVNGKTQVTEVSPPKWNDDGILLERPAAKAGVPLVSNGSADGRGHKASICEQSSNRIAVHDMFSALQNNDIMINFDS